MVAVTSIKKGVTMQSFPASHWTGIRGGAVPKGNHISMLPGGALEAELPLGSKGLPWLGAETRQTTLMYF